MQNKLSLLKKKLSGYDRIAIAFSGGVDSTLLLACAHQVLDSGTLAVTATGANFAPDETKEAEDFCVDNSIPHLLININDDIMSVLKDNPVDRCYKCKLAIFTQIQKTLDYMPIADGSNADDCNDYRPGRMALKELGILSPLEEVGMTKSEVRDALRAMNLPVWNKPAYACLATRIPYGVPATSEKMAIIYSLEKEIRDRGFRQVRVRHHGDIARVEVPADSFKTFCTEKNMRVINTLIRDAGFNFATLDLGGYSAGSLNPSQKD